MFGPRSPSAGSWSSSLGGLGLQRMACQGLWTRVCDVVRTEFSEHPARGVARSKPDMVRVVRNSDRSSPTAALQSHRGLGCRQPGGRRLRRRHQDRAGWPSTTTFSTGTPVRDPVASASARSVVGAPLPRSRRPNNRRHPVRSRVAPDTDRPQLPARQFGLTKRPPQGVKARIRSIYPHNDHRLLA